MNRQKFNMPVIVHNALQLPPLLSSQLQDFVFQMPGTLFQWVEQYGSPLHLIWPEALKQNLARLTRVLEEHHLPHKIYYGAKVNKSKALIEAVLQAGAGVDVSSRYEMQDALQFGADGSHLCATGPAKTADFHELLIAQGALISIDSAEEFEDLICHLSLEYPARILLRYRPISAGDSRFGMPSKIIVQCLQHIKNDPRLIFEGFHMHLSGYQVDSRLQALRELLPLVAAAHELGLVPKLIDIGGGLPVQYVASSFYEAFIARQTSKDYRNGFVPEGFYPYGGAFDAATWLAALLDSEIQNGVSVARYFADHHITFALEPGRALADQTAISLFRIIRVKALGNGRYVIFVEGSSFNACETWFSSEFLVDPILLSVCSSASNHGPVHAYLAGQTCLDDDILSNRWISFKALPCADDLLVYANTGGYQMDLLENEFHRHPMPKRMYVRSDSNGVPIICADTV